MMDDLHKDLRESLLRWLPLPTAFVFFYISLLITRLFGFQPLATYGIIALVVFVCLFTQWLKERNLHLASYVFVIGLTLASWVLIQLFFSPLSVVTLPAVILLSLAILGFRSMVIIVVISSLVILGSALQRGQLNNMVLGPMSIVWLTAVAAWLFQRNLNTALEWAWSSFQHAQKLLEEVREHRGELARTIKALDNAYLRLERFSRQLAEAREAAEEARRAKQQFVANVSHELRTPLNIIIGFSEMLTQSPETYDIKSIPHRFMGDINRIYRSAQHLKSLIDDVLDLSRIDAGRMPLIAEPASLSTLMIEAMDMMESLAAQKGLTLTIQVPDSLPPVFLDRLRIRQVLLNLLSNAIRFTERGKIAISVQLEAEKIQVTVADTGQGIAPKDLDKVFEEFQQLDGSLERRYGGTGLGLALSRRFVELHGGHMWVESELDKGSRFHFTLPLPLANPSLTLRSSSAPSISKTPVGPTILVNTDEPMVVSLLKRHLQGYQVIGVSEENLSEATETYLPNAVITSSMGQTFGTKTRPPHVPFISCPLPDPRYLSRELGVDHYLVKPVNLEQMLKLLENYGDTVRRVLIVDDDVQFVELMARIVHAAPHPYVVDIACGGEEGIAQMRKSPPDLVLLDLMMRGIDGLAMLKLIRNDNRLRNVHVVIVTARDLPDDDIFSLPHNRILMEGPEGLTLTEALNCLQSILNALPVPKPVFSPHPGLEANPPDQSVF